jgi:hypothetical protein
VLKHFVVTRLGLGVYHQPWYESTLGLFEAITYPSLRAQTSRDFTWLIVVDRHIPEPALKRLKDIVGGERNLHVVPLDLTNLRHVRHGCFDHVWHRCQDYIIEHRLLADPSEYIITSSIDADDAWHRNIVALAHEQSEPELARLVGDERGRSAVVRHTCGQVLTFPRGLRWFAEADVVQPFEYEFLGMSIFVLARFSSGISVLASRHSAWSAMAHALMFDVKKAEVDRPMWVYVRHDRTQVDWRVEASEDDAGCKQALQRDFGIDFAKVAAWRTNGALRRAADQTDRHGGLSSREQHDCIFQIASLNRQIAVLQQKQQRDGLDDGDEQLMLQQRQARLKLLARLRQQGRQLFE